MHWGGVTVGSDWLEGPRSPMDFGRGSSGDSGTSGGGNSKFAAFGMLAFIAGPAGLVLGLAAYLAHGYGLI